MPSARFRWRACTPGITRATHRCASLFPPGHLALGVNRDGALLVALPFDVLSWTPQSERVFTALAEFRRAREGDVEGGPAYWNFHTPCSHSSGSTRVSGVRALSVPAVGILPE